ncbi:MmgE/PrpD family protein [Oceaniovalibus guishaninsula JLT2003]|uniref:MmgE/PrpD family protein n=1 Tax=Oceaniovalibus guishaninsula JLT2003 TaxID=1231392 RepID=K2HAC6_9RHOB|nr:MmgE/PrpD family protein [Oceaniovalibus guishaninsula]EKE43587.1 MmgE/PrpD family protein [Oceaniovalibus guishaninsula JLT2003]
MNTGSPTDALIDFALAPVRHRPARNMLRLSLHDWAACGMAGRSEPVARALRGKALDEGGAERATLLGGGRVPAPGAALVNGATSHALDYDDTHFAHVGHPSVAVIPAALAVAERTGATLDALRDAALIGAEASVRIGVWLGRDHYLRGFHQTGTAGAFGAALAAGRLLGLDAAGMRTALGLASTRTGGLKSQFGTMGKPLNAGLAAETGVQAALWAQAGLTSAQDGLAGPQGFGATHHGAGDGAAMEGLGQTWLFERISHKFHACCHGLHAMLEALATLDVPAADVASVEVRTNPRWLDVCDIAHPRTGLECKFSYGITAAMALTGRDTGAIATFSDDAAGDAGLIALAGRVRAVADAGLSDMQAEVTVTRASGEVLRARHDLAAPMAMDDRQARLRRKAVSLVGPDTEAALWNAPDLAALVAVLGQRAEQ